MFKPESLTILVLLFLFALVVRQPSLSLLLGLLLLALLIASRWSIWGLRRLRYERKLNQTHAFVGDDVILTLRVVNDKLLGVPVLECRDFAPTNCTYQGTVLLSARPNNVVLERSLALRPYEAVSWQVRLRCSHRGLLTFGPVELTAGDPFGLYSTTEERDDRVHLVVYPQLVSLGNFHLHPRKPGGDRRAPPQLLSDPLHTVGIRDYHPSDPFKAIHWAASARRGSLQSRVWEPTGALELVIVLDLDTFEHYWEGILPDLVEHLIRVAASLASLAEHNRWSFGLWSNAGLPGSDQLIRIKTGRHPDQLGVVLDILARVIPYSVIGLPRLLARSAADFPARAVVVVIGAVASDDVCAAILNLTRHGRDVRWLWCGSAPPPILPGITVSSHPWDA
ncbi:MAG: DUF58 domain-containing protein [Herpetosiphon sp.]